MRKKTLQDRNLLYRYYKKFCNLQKRISLLMRSGEFFDLSREIQHRLIRRLKILYERVQRLAGKQRLKWAGAAMALMLSAFAANAQFNDPVSLSGFTVKDAASQEFVDFDNDGDMDIVIGNNGGTISYIQNDDGAYSSAINPFSYIDVGGYAMPSLADLDDDGDLDLLVGDGYTGTFRYFQNDAGTFTEMTGIDNPFDGVDLGWWSQPCFVNFDGDDDIDMVAGEGFGVLHYFENDGGVFTELTGVDNPFDVVSIPGYDTAPTFADMDDDGDLDLIVGEWYGTIWYYRNIAGVFTEETGSNNPFDGMDIGWLAKPSVWDVDADGDLDLVIGDYLSDILRFFRNDAGTFTEKRGTPNPFEGLLGFSGAAPAFSDIDNDGDLDVLIGEKYGTQRYYENTNEGFIPRFDDFPFDTIASTFIKPIFADVDGDLDEDLVIGEVDGTLLYYSKEGPNDFVELTGSNNPFDGIDVGGYSAPALVDLDDDGDLDLFIGSKTSSYPDPTAGSISYFRNVSGDFVQQTGAANPFESIFTTDTIASGLNPAFIDIDRDGDLDVFVGVKYAGNILHYVNNGGTFTLAEGSANPFDGIILGYNPSLAFADVDEDGDMDLYVGIQDYFGDGRVYFFENTQGPIEPPVSVPALTDDNGSVNIYSYGSTLVVDAGAQNLERIEVYSSSGQIFKAVDLNRQGRYELNLPDAIAGLYIIRVFSDGVPTTDKVILR